MSFVPKKLIQDGWLTALGRVEHGSIEFIGPDGNSWSFAGPKPGPAAQFHIRDWSVIERLVARGDIGLGEDFIAGAWDSNDIEALISFFLLNIDHLEGF